MRTLLLAFYLKSGQDFDSFFSLLDGVGQEGREPVRSGVVAADHVVDGLEDVLVRHLHHSLSGEKQKFY